MERFNRSFSLAAIFVAVSLFSSSFMVMANTGLGDKKPTHTPKAIVTAIPGESQSGEKGNKPDDRGKSDDKGKPTNTGKPEDKGEKREHYLGVVAGFDGTTLSLTMDDASTLTFQLNDDTHIKIPGKQDAIASDLPVGGDVFVQAVKGEFDALIATSISLIPGKPQPLHRVGIVNDYQPNISISIENKKDGVIYTFLVNDQTKFLPADRLEQLTVGTLVTIISPRDTSGGAPQASGIVIHPVNSANTDDQAFTGTPDTEFIATPTPTPTGTNLP